MPRAEDPGQLHVDITLLARVDRTADGRISSVAWYPDGYVRYVKLMNDWAGALQCRADSIEMFLFMGT